MDNLTCCFIGHRKINESQELKVKLFGVIENLIVNHNVLTFLFGSKSDFDYLCYNVVTALKEKYPAIKRVCYTCKSESCVLESERVKWDRVYSNFFGEGFKFASYEEEFEHKTKYTSCKAGYVERNQAMIDNSDFCIFYFDENYKPELRKYSKKSNGYYQPKSGTAISYAYANKKKKKIINVF